MNTNDPEALDDNLMKAGDDNLWVEAPGFIS